MRDQLALISIELANKLSLRAQAYELKPTQARALIKYSYNRVLIDLMICLACLAVRYGVGCRHRDAGNSGKKSANSRSKSFRRKSRHQR